MAIWGNQWCSFDTETTGFGPNARIIEIAIVHFEGERVLREWSTFLNPEGVDYTDSRVMQALDVNHIKPEDLVGAPRWQDIAPQVLGAFAEADVWVAHNAKFDRQMIDQEFARFPSIEKLQTPLVTLCTQNLSAKIVPHAIGNKLFEVADRWGVTPGGAHRAVVDAITCGKVLASMVEKNTLPYGLEELIAFNEAAAKAWASRPKRR